MRCGFADYFEPQGHHADHVFTEYWDQTRGSLLADSQLTDPIIADAFAVDFDPMDAARDLLGNDDRLPDAYVCIAR